MKPIVLKRYLEKITSSVSVDMFLGPKSWKERIWGENISDGLIKFSAEINKVIASGFLPYLIFGKKFF